MLDAYVELEAGAMLLPPSSPDKERRMWTCIGIDPGGTTGWCVLRIHKIAMCSPEYRILENVAYWSAGQITGEVNRQIDKLVDLVEAWSDAEVVCEDFVLRKYHGGRELLDPVRVISPLAWWLERGGRRQWDVVEGEDWHPRKLQLQQPALAMTTVTDDRLKAWGVYQLTSGQPHARDALRHALTFARRRKLTNLQEAK